MGENPALLNKREKDFEKFKKGDEVKFIPPPHLNPGLDMDKDATIGKVLSKDPRKRTLRVSGIPHPIDPSSDDVYKKAGRRSTASKKRVHRTSHRTLKNLRKRRATQKH